MRKYLLLSILAVFGAGFMSALNCSKPVDLSDLGQSGIDTVFVQDTVVYSDTIYIDSVRVDTVYIDTLYNDTTIIDTTLCARLSSHRQEIVWLLFNPEGDYRMHFRAATDQRRCLPELIVDIDDLRYRWNLDDDLEFIVEKSLSGYSTIRITSTEPHAFGHPIDICLHLDLH